MSNKSRKYSDRPMPAREPIIEAPSIMTPLSIEEEPLIEEAPAEPVAEEVIAPVPAVKRERIELSSEISVSASKITITVDIAMDDIPLIQTLKAKVAQADAKAKALASKVSGAIQGDSVVSLSPAKLDLVSKQVILELDLEPALGDERLEAVREGLT